MSKLDNENRPSEYNTWANMRQRCNNPNFTQYADYGGRGIKHCQQWSNFEGFINDMGYKNDPSLSLERLDTNGDYTKENCIWADRRTQNLNQRYRTDNKSGRVGVHWSNKQNGWIVQIQISGKRTYLGKFESFEEACLVREQAELEHYGFIKEKK